MRKFNELVRLFLIACIGLALGCKSDQTLNREVKILIRSNNDCTNILLLGKDGSGEVQRGIGDPYREKFTKLRSIDEKFNYTIKSNEDMDFINKTIDSISNQGIYEQGFLRDATHYELYIDGEKKIDVYGARYEILHSVIKTIWNNLPKELNYFCQ